MYFHYQNLKKEEKSTRYIVNGRCWIGHHPQLRFEWFVPGRNLSLQLHLCDHGDDALGGHIGLWFFTLYWGLEWRILRKILEPITRRRDQKYSNGRNIGFSLDSEAISVMLWYDPMEHRGRDPWWWHQYFSFSRLGGRAVHSEELIEAREVTIPMPEGSYPATARLVLASWKKPFWFTKSVRRVSIEVSVGIPFPGKGENSWDCGPDATSSMTCSAHSIAEGVGKLVGHVLDNRVRYGGYGNWDYNKR